MVGRILMLVCCLFVANHTYAQDVTIDSLLLEFEQVDDSDEKYTAYRRVTRYLFSIDADLALAHCNFYHTKIQPKNTDLFFWMGVDKASLLTSLNRGQDAINVMKSLLRYAEEAGNFSRQATFSQTLARKFIRLNLPDSANSYLILAEKISNRHKINDLLWSIANTRAMLAGYLGDTQEEADSFEQSWRLMKKYAPETKEKGYLLYIIADHFYESQNWAKYAYYNELLILHFKAKKKDIPMNHMPISSHVEDDNPMKFIRETIRVLNVADSLGKISTYIMTTFELDQAYQRIDKVSLATPYLLRAEELINVGGDYYGARQLYQKIERNFELQGKFRKAFEYARKGRVLRDSIYQQDKAERIAEMNAKYELEKKERQIVEQNLSLEKQKLQRSFYQFGAILIGLLALMSGVYYHKRLKYHQKISEQDSVLHEQKITELKQEKDIEVMSAMLNGQEKERGRLAKDLHDGLGGELSALKSHFQGVVKDFPKLEESNNYRKVLGLITNAGDEVRRVAHNIMPRALSLAGLKPAVEDMAESLAIHDIDCKVEIINLPTGCPKEKEIMIFRIIQEMINNIKKHSGAKSVFIQIFGKPNFVNLLIEDDGVGFDVEQALKKNGMGLSSINSRVAFLNGKIVWDSVKGQGTTVNIEIPIK